MNFTPRPDLPIDLAGLAQAMVALASEIADDIVLWACPASYVRDVIVPTVRDARSAAGKDADSFATVAALAFLRPGLRVTALDPHAPGAERPAPGAAAAGLADQLATPAGAIGLSARTGDG